MLHRHTNYFDGFHANYSKYMPHDQNESVDECVSNSVG
jgi:hypothetical protein